MTTEQKINQNVCQPTMPDVQSKTSWTPMEKSLVNIEIMLKNRGFQTPSGYSQTGLTGRKAGARGWLATWKARVRKDVDRQRAKSNDKKEQSRIGDCTTSLGARLALDRRRNRQGKVR